MAGEQDVQPDEGEGTGTEATEDEAAAPEPGAGAVQGASTGRANRPVDARIEGK